MEKSPSTCKLIFHSIEHDLVRISYYSYWEENASFLFQRSWESVEFCPCLKDLLWFGSCKSCTAVLTNLDVEFAGKKFHVLHQNRVILFLYNYITIRDRVFCQLQEKWLWCIKTQETVLQDFGMMLTYKDICPTSCLSAPTHPGSHPSLWIQATKMFIILREI